MRRLYFLPRKTSEKGPRFVEHCETCVIYILPSSSSLPFAGAFLHLLGLLPPPDHRLTDVKPRIHVRVHKTDKTRRKDSLGSKNEEVEAPTSPLTAVSKDL